MVTKIFLPDVIPNFLVRFMIWDNCRLSGLLSYTGLRYGQIGGNNPQPFASRLVPQAKDQNPTPSHKSFPGKIASTNFPWRVGWPTPPPSLSNSLILLSLLCDSRELHINTIWPTMGIVSLSLVLHSRLVSPYHSQTRPIRLSQSNWFQAPIPARTKHTSLSIIRAQSGARKEEIVIVGAGIAGLATALSLHR